jgi:hypothetical protein
MAGNGGEKKMTMSSVGSDRAMSFAVHFKRNESGKANASWEGRKEGPARNTRGWMVEGERRRGGGANGTYVCLCIHNMHTLGLIYSRSFLLFPPPLSIFPFPPRLLFSHPGRGGDKNEGPFIDLLFPFNSPINFFFLFFSFSFLFP